TYAPADMVVSFDSAGGGQSVRFTANFGGTLTPRAYAQVFFYPRSTALSLARTTVDNFISGLDPEVDRSVSEAPEPWAFEQTSFSYPHEQQTYIGRIALAQRGDIVFHLLAHYPAEYADGMGPRIAAVLHEWRWADGTPLMRGARGGGNVGSPLVWVVFNLAILALLALDLGVFHRRAHAVSIREAAGWSTFWVALSLLFNLGIYLLVGRDEALEFLTGYLIEKS